MSDFKVGQIYNIFFLTQVVLNGFLLTSNPKYILRNYLAQEAIEAAQQGDFSTLNKLVEALKNPFTENKKYNEFSKAPPEWGKKLEISCSS